MEKVIENNRYTDQKLKNRWHTALLLVGMLILSSLMGWFFAGIAGILWVMVATMVSVLLSPRLTSRWILRRFRARVLKTQHAPSLYAKLRELTHRAGLSTMPTIVYLPTRHLSAFTTGSRDDAVIALSDGLLRALNDRELSGVMAHEISHLKNNDLQMMNLSTTFNQFTSILSSIGQILLLLNLPLLLSSEFHFPWIGILFLIFAPTLAMLLQLALSRTREFDADLGAAALTGDPRGLAAGLFKIEQHQRGWLRRFRWMGHGHPSGTIWSTHPPTGERIHRLMEIAPTTTSHPYVTDQRHHGWLREPFSPIRPVYLVR